MDVTPSYKSWLLKRADYTRIKGGDPVHNWNPISIAGAYRSYLEDALKAGDNARFQAILNHIINEQGGGATSYNILNHLQSGSGGYKPLDLGLKFADDDAVNNDKAVVAALRHLKREYGDDWKDKKIESPYITFSPGKYIRPGSSEHRRYQHSVNSYYDALGAARLRPVKGTLDSFNQLAVPVLEAPPAGQQPPTAPPTAPTQSSFSKFVSENPGLAIGGGGLAALAGLGLMKSVFGDKKKKNKKPAYDA